MGGSTTPPPPPSPLHSSYSSHFITAFNRLFAAVYAAAILALFYHHILSILRNSSISSSLISLALLVADFILAFMWVAGQSFRMIPVRRREFPEKLKRLAEEDFDFPAVDVFICTTDPDKEPPMSVVNSVLSVMAYDYPVGKISVYISDDGGSALTLFALTAAAKFARHWVPFCKKNDVVKRNPEAFFASTDNEFWNFDTEKIKKVEDVIEKGEVGDKFIDGEEDRLTFNKWTKSFTPQSHPTIIKVVLESKNDKDMMGHSLPNLVYVSREKSKAFHHHFKSGALNALLRVSATMTNAPIILTLDCDMYSNDPQTLFRALCYALDPELKSNLGYIQFPQCFKGVSINDIYASEMKRTFEINSIGMDGLLGPDYFGTGTFFTRRAFFGGPLSLESFELSPDYVVCNPIRSKQTLDLAHEVAACDYENNTKWGSKVGIRYGSLAEDFYTSYCMHCEGWRSILCNPNRAAFYGNAPISLLDALSQLKRWAVGALEVGFSKSCTITYGMKSIGVLMGLCYAYYSFWPLWSIPIIVYAFLPQSALIYGISVFPKGDELLVLLYTFLFFGAYGQDLVEFLMSGSTFGKWWNDQRMWMIKGVSCSLCGFIEFALKSLGISSYGFEVTSKVMEEERTKRYNEEKFEFGVWTPMFIPMTMAAILNFGCLVIGFMRIFKDGWNNLDEISMFGQMFIAGFVTLNCWPIYEAMVFRNDEGKLPLSITFASIFLLLGLLSIPFFISTYSPYLLLF
ncbi:cellulose synthase-like protein G3 isoform X2 [Cucumis melo]|uniref:Cellulose synthase-like protein G3 isoform X2 n=1 Tax=Cucumis melo TaxID=3656 RepID=A0ABM3KZA3_CUCME|nr:cellulose synthase-like protein G3 isoform X2 [Cucumis melo]